uniref:DUF5672 domain-containing protein n=1 Tax=viral metagenome TaxID=1070528 RepID=A0A6C0IIA4_9ZZZZ
MFIYTALIIEPRKHNALKFVINNFFQNLSDEWGILIFYGNNNFEYVKNIVDNLEEKYKNRIINLVNLNVDNLNSRTYSQLFFTTQFYDHIPTNTFLVFQTDSIILKENKDIINLFLDFDYVGAPWKLNKNVGNGRLSLGKKNKNVGNGGLSLGKKNNNVGNGGLSLRKKNKMLEILQSKPLENINEDVFFSSNINSSIQYNVPDYILAQKFSVETVFYDKPFGIHNCWKYITKEECEVLKNTYAEINELILLNN